MRVQPSGLATKAAPVQPSRRPPAHVPQLRLSRPPQLRPQPPPARQSLEAIVEDDEEFWPTWPTSHQPPANDDDEEQLQDTVAEDEVGESLDEVSVEEQQQPPDADEEDQQPQLHSEEEEEQQPPPDAEEGEQQTLFEEPMSESWGDEWPAPPEDEEEQQQPPQRTPEDEEEEEQPPWEVEQQPPPVPARVRQPMRPTTKAAAQAAKAPPVKAPPILNKSMPAILARVMSLAPQTPPGGPQRLPLQRGPGPPPAKAGSRRGRSVTREPNVRRESSGSARSSDAEVALWTTQVSFVASGTPQRQVRRRGSSEPADFSERHQRSGAQQPAVAPAARRRGRSREKPKILLETVGFKWLGAKPLQVGMYIPGDTTYFTCTFCTSSGGRCPTPLVKTAAT